MAITTLSPAGVPGKPRTFADKGGLLDCALSDSAVTELAISDALVSNISISETLQT